jgi:hypothetical protein
MMPSTRKRGPFPKGRRPAMIGRRGYRIAERPCAFHRPQSGAPQQRGAPRQARAPRQAGVPQQAEAPRPGVARHSARDPPPDIHLAPRPPVGDGEELGRPPVGDGEESDRPPVGDGGMDRPPSAAASNPGKGAGPAEPPASPDRTKLHRNQITERSRGMTTHITSARAGCKRPGRRSSCGIVLAANVSHGSGGVP